MGYKIYNFIPILNLILVNRRIKGYIQKYIL